MQLIDRPPRRKDKTNPDEFVDDPFSTAEVPKKILIVDDEPELLEILGKRLSFSGYEVVKAENGIEGIRKAQREEPDLIILDQLMPDVSGDEVADILKHNPNTQDTPIIYLSCLYSNWDGIQDNYLFEDSAYFGKPYDPKTLLGTIEALI